MQAKIDEERQRAEGREAALMAQKDEVLGLLALTLSLTRTRTRTRTLALTLALALALCVRCSAYSPRSDAASRRLSVRLGRPTPTRSSRRPSPLTSDSLVLTTDY